MALTNNLQASAPTAQKSASPRYFSGRGLPRPAPAVSGLFTIARTSRGSRTAFHGELCFSVNHLQSTLTRLPISVDSKRLTEKLGSLESTLTKNRGAGAPLFACPLLAELPCRSSCLPAEAELACRSSRLHAEAGRPVGAAVVVPLEPRCFPTEKALYPFSLHIATRHFPTQRRGYTPTPSASMGLFHGIFTRCLCGHSNALPQKTFFVSHTSYRAKLPGARWVYTVGEKA